MTTTVLDYVLLVRAKNLMMVTHEHVYNGEEDKVEKDFDLFNHDYTQYTESFLKVTGSIYQPGQQPDITKPILRSFRGSTSVTSSANLRGLTTKTNRADSVPVYPPTLTVSSDQGPAGEEQWDTMGEYTRSVEDHDNKPVFW